MSVIHLFLRSNSASPYVYCGTLGYLSHDISREQPVHFQWQLLEWPPIADVRSALGVALEESTTESPTPPAPHQLIQVPVPQVVRRGGRDTERFAGNRQATHPDQSARNSALGLAGEMLVLRLERS
jgi:hypothetical protein